MNYTYEVVAAWSYVCCICGSGTHTDTTYATMMHKRNSESKFACSNCFPLIDDDAWLSPLPNTNFVRLMGIYNEVFADTMPIDEFLRLVKAGSLEI